LSNYYVDTSALAKRYIAEVGSAWLRSWIRPKAGNTILISRLTTIEMVSVLMGKQRASILTSADFTRIRNNFFDHMRKQYTLAELDTPVFSTARRMLVKHPLRSLDAIQLACALEGAKSLGSPLTFVSADVRLLAAASAEGLAVDNPNAHP
jgi:predicted nucleic acid-binding protein